MKAKTIRNRQGFVKKILSLLTVSTLSSCTLFSPPNPGFDYNLADHCAHGDSDCIIDVMDEHRFESHTPERRVKYMDGYPPVMLGEMRDRGALEISKMNPLVLAGSTALLSPVLGVAMVRAGDKGAIYSCKVWYTTNYTMIHELQHCKGYMEGAWTGYPNFLMDNYTSEQRRIMKEEGVDRWEDTDYFKYIIPTEYSYQPWHMEWHQQYLEAGDE
jgi:hypothetical protein